MREILGKLYREHRQGFYSLALALTGSREQAEDAVQETFARLVHQAKVEDPLPYAYRTLRNVAIDSRRRGRRTRQLAESLFNGYYQPPASSETPDQVLTREREELLRQAVSELGEEDKEAVVLKALAGLTFDQIGQVLEVSPKTVTSRYRRALIKLQQKLRGQI